MRVNSFMNDLFGSLTAVIIDGEVWFYANDVCNILTYQQPSHAVLRHTFPEDRKTLKYKARDETALALWGENDYNDKTFINESGLYCLIFGSKTSKAQEFKKWVTGTVLPAIRENGGYIEGQENLGAQELEDLRAEIRGLYKRVNAEHADGNMWMDLYFKTQEELQKTKQRLKDANISLREWKKEDHGNIPVYITRDGFLVPASCKTEDITGAELHTEEDD